MEQQLSRRCTVHPTFVCDFIHLKPSIDSPFVCSLCRSKQHIPDNEVAKISEIIDAHPDTFMRNYPILTDPQTLEAAERITGEVEAMQSSLDSFFTKITGSFLASLEKAKQSMKYKILIMSKAYREVRTGVQQAAQLEKFKEGLCCLDSEQIIKEFIRERYAKAEQNTQQIQQKLSVFKSLASGLCFSQAKEIEEIICGLVQEIDLLPQMPCAIGLKLQECYSQTQLKQKKQDQKSLGLLVNKLQGRLEIQKQSIEEIEQKQKKLESLHVQIQVAQQHKNDQKYEVVQKQHKKQQHQEETTTNELKLQQQNEQLQEEEQLQQLLNQQQDIYQQQIEKQEEEEEEQQQQDSNNNAEEQKHQQLQFSEYHILHNQLHPMQQYLLGIQYDQYNYKKWLDLSEVQRVNIISVVKDELKKSVQK